VRVPLGLPCGSREEVKKIEKSRKKHGDEDDWGKTRELPDRPGIVRSSSWSPSILLMTNKSRTKRTKDVDELTSTIIARLSPWGQVKYFGRPNAGNVGWGCRLGTGQVAAGCRRHLTCPHSRCRVNR
jgi:hypothetical protein